MNSVYKPCPAALYSAVQSHCSILSHDALRHCLSNNSSLENGERELGHFFRYCRSFKNTSTILLGEREYSATGNSRVHFSKSGYVIQLIAFRWDMGLYTQFTRSCRPFPSFAEVGRACETRFPARRSREEHSSTMPYSPSESRFKEQNVPMATAV